MPTYKFDHLYAATEWLSPGYIAINADGWVTAVSDQSPTEDCQFLNGIAVPGIPNLHSHAFQRAMAGLSEYRTAAAEDSFWTWRELMYRFVDHITPDDLEAIAAQLYVEMLKAGYTSVGEFQYLHHDRDGTSFKNPAEMTLRTLAAATSSGIGATLLPVLYQQAGFGNQPPGEGQRRFINGTDKFLEIYKRSRKATSLSSNLNTGVAPHSLRAAGVHAISVIIDEIGASDPIHLHIAEQEQEVVDCKAFSGMRPVQYLLDRMPVDHRWCLVHATHMTFEESCQAAASGAIAGLCPTTEANLGDGLFDLPVWQKADGGLGVGSDSHISVSPVEELRWLEYGQRLRDRRRNISADEQVSTGQKLFNAVISGGAQALGRQGPLGESGLQVGARADIVVLDHEAPVFAGHTKNTFLDAWIFSGNAALVTDVFAGGSHVIKNGKHAMEEAIEARYKDVLSGLLRV